MSQQISEEIEMSVLGVPGKLVRTGNDARKPGCWMNQKWTSTMRTRTVKGEKLLVVAEIRFDDNCGNGHNSFAITGHGWYDYHKARDWDFGGCRHDTIEVVFPELKHLIKWHLVDTSGPMHYVANTVYHASNLHNGKAKGEPCKWETRLRFTDLPTMTFGINSKLALALQEAKSTKHVPGVLDLVEVPYVKTPGGSDYQFGPHYTLGCYPVQKWHEAPYKSKGEALEWQAALLNSDWELVKVVTDYSPGKERDLDAARSCANWPEATDEQLMLPAAELTKLLEARLPPLLTEFRADVEAAGFLWERPE